MMSRPFRPGDRVRGLCDCGVESPVGVVAALDPPHVVVEFQAYEVTAHLAAHGLEYVNFIAPIDQDTGAHGNAETILRPFEPAELVTDP